jgi:GntR family transcriptional regulator, galactonate operon transcriptional repressor
MKVKLRPLPQQVASVLVRRIAAGELPNGLAPSEVQICIEFGVSRAVAREALKILSVLVEWLPSPHVHELLRELHEARLVFEPAIAAKAAQTLTDASLARLRDCLDAMAAHEDDPDRYLELDLEFHMEICRATRNRILDRFMYSSRWWQQASRRLSNRAPRALPEATKHHRKIYEALAARDPKRAAAAMREHLMLNTLLLMADAEEVE